MWTAIIASFVKIIESIFGIWRHKEEVKQKEFEIKNTEEQRIKAEKREDVIQKDNAETIVKTAIDETSTEQQKKEALDEIRRRVAG